MNAAPTRTKLSLQMRLLESDREMIESAASNAGLTPTAFVRFAALTAARQRLVFVNPPANTTQTEQAR